MILAELIIRLIVAIMEAYVEELRKADPKQVQLILDRRERDLARADKLIDQVWPGWLPDKAPDEDALERAVGVTEQSKTTGRGAVNTSHSKPSS